MPIPRPGEEEKKDAFISRCISAVTEADPDRKQDQIVAMCFDAWRDAEKQKETTPLKFMNYIGEASLDEQIEWLREDLRSMWSATQGANQRIDDLIAAKFSKKPGVLHVQSFKWQDGVASPCELDPCVKFKSFAWVPELKMPDWATGRLYTFSTLGSPITADGQVFDEAQRNRCAASITGAPISIDHAIYKLVGQNVVLDADVEDNRMEGLCYVEDPNLNTLYDDGKIAGCSIEYFDRPTTLNPDGTTSVKGTLCVGLSFITVDHLAKGYRLGDPLSIVTALKQEIDEMRLALNVLTARFDAPPTIAEIPDDAFAFVGDGERKLQMMTAEGEYDEGLLKAAVAELARDLLPPAAVPDARAKLREGFKALALPVPDEIVENTTPLIDTLDPKIAKKLQVSLDRRAKFRTRFQRDWTKEELE